VRAINLSPLGPNASNKDFYAKIISEDGEGDKNSGTPFELGVAAHLYGKYLAKVLNARDSNNSFKVNSRLQTDQSGKVITSTLPSITLKEIWENIPKPFADMSVNWKQFGPRGERLKHAIARTNYNEEAIDAVFQGTLQNEEVVVGLQMKDRITYLQSKDILELRKYSSLYSNKRKMDGGDITHAIVVYLNFHDGDWPKYTRRKKKEKQKQEERKTEKNSYRALQKGGKVFITSGKGLLIPFWHDSFY